MLVCIDRALFVHCVIKSGKIFPEKDKILKSNSMGRKVNLNKNEEKYLLSRKFF